MVQRSSQYIGLSPPASTAHKGGEKGIIIKAREVFSSCPSTQFKWRSDTLSGEKDLEPEQRRTYVPSEGGVRRAGLSLGGQLSCLNSKLWGFLFCEMAQRCLQEQDCLSYHLSLPGSPLTSLAALPLRGTGRPLARLSLAVSWELSAVSFTVLSLPGSQGRPARERAG